MEIQKSNSLIKFDRQFPIYNFFFPNQGNQCSEKTIVEVVQQATGYAKSRALYFHIPFCDTICNFCPFTRGLYDGRQEIDQYFESLLSEIRLKSEQLDLREVQIGAIFFGGGTPSLLSANQIIRIGELINHTFDLTQLREFSFEIEVKSLTLEKALAMRQIGVTHPRFGLQTFSQKWRDMFNLTATLAQIHDATKILTEVFEFQTFDILYGMSGQDEEELISDLQSAVSLGTSNIDIYPIDNVMTQVRLHSKIVDAKLMPTSAMRKFSMNVLVDQFMRHSGFMPHNGHGYVRIKATSAVVSLDYSFVYHEHVYGYHNFDLLGFGVNAVSSTMEHVVTNTHNKKIYRDSIMAGAVACSISQHDASLDYARPIILRLPYHGVIEKSLVQWDKVHPEVIFKLDVLKQQGMVAEDKNTLMLTKLGWYWYVNIMYFLMPKEDQLKLNSLVVNKLKVPGRQFSKTELLYPIFSQAKS